MSPTFLKKKTWVSFSYEKLQDYCYNCGRLGHESMGWKYGEQVKDEERNPLYGQGLGVSLLKPLQVLSAVKARVQEKEERRNPPPTKNTSQAIRESSEQQSTLHMLQDGKVTFPRHRRVCPWLFLSLGDSFIFKFHVYLFFNLNSGYMSIILFTPKSPL